jgi:predicted outer membrane repeat protein
MSKKVYFFKWAVITLLLMSCNIALADKIIYVDDDATGANNGSSWQNAYKYLQDALTDANAAEKPVEIRVAQGTYKPDQGAGQTAGNRNATFQLINGVTLSGGYAGLGVLDPNIRDIKQYETILSGDLAGNDVDVNDPEDLPDEPNRAENSYNVITTRYPDYSDIASILDNVTITGGNLMTSPLGGKTSGGGILMRSGKLKISNCTFIRNTGEYGGGIYAYYGNLTINNCTFKDNYAFSGGGIYADGSYIKVIGCSFTNNIAGYYGGAISDQRNYNGLIVQGCTFIGNSASRGGGIYATTFTYDININNCTMKDNNAIYGKALAFSENSYISNIFLNNSIIRNGQDSSIWNTSLSNLKINYCDIQNGRNSIYDPNGKLVWGQGNIDKDPLFADSNNGDFHLKSEAGRFDPKMQSWVIDAVTSPCIDAGDPNRLIGYEPFPNGGKINMGAYGGTAQASKSYFGKPLCETIIAGDINGDCRVDSNDLLILMNHWLEDKNPVSLIVINGIELRVQTDKNFYHQGETVQMTVSVTNLTNTTFTKQFLYLSVQKDDDAIFTLIVGVNLEVPAIKLTPGQSMDFTYNWNMKDKYHCLIGPGTYQVVVEIPQFNTEYYEPVQVRTTITVTADDE